MQANKAAETEGGKKKNTEKKGEREAPEMTESGKQRQLDGRAGSATVNGKQCKEERDKEPTVSRRACVSVGGRD